MFHSSYEYHYLTFCLHHLSFFFDGSSADTYIDIASISNEQYVAFMGHTFGLVDAGTIFKQLFLGEYS